jgi:hypothetical protein
MVTYKAANENDPFQPEMEMSEGCVRHVPRNSHHGSELSRIPKSRHNLAREFTSQDNAERPCLERTNTVKKHLGFQVNPLAGFYLTTIGRFLGDH